jgi:hypothetical protein
MGAARTTMARHVPSLERQQVALWLHFDALTGFVFHFGCFAQAEGCAVDGPPTAEATWFPAFAWQVAHFAACHTHLGWAFCGEGDFFGRLLDRLTLPS